MAANLSLFNADWYLKQNPDVADAVQKGLITAELHFETQGKFEGRAPGPLFNQAGYLADNPDVAKAVADGVISAYDHFLLYGAGESRSPLRMFDEAFYLAQNPDVAVAVEAGLTTAVQHFLMYGQGEPRAINPAIDLGAYLAANPDVLDAASKGLVSPLEHLMLQGPAEGRDLGNGINLGLFTQDPAFQIALESGNIDVALSRVNEVAPFIPTFEPPANWTPPSDLPIPTDFVPPEGVKLVIPEGVEIPEGTDLPDTFVPPTPTPTPTPDPTPTPTYTLAEALGLESLPANFRLSDEAGYLEEVDLRTAEVIEASSNSTDYSYHTVVDETISLVARDDLILESEEEVLTANLSLSNSSVRLPNDQSTNVLVHDEGGDTTLKDLTVTVTGEDNTLDLGNGPGQNSIGYFLDKVTVNGAGNLKLSTLYFGNPGTVFDSSDLNGNMHLEALVYTGSGSKDVGRYDWSINFGAGDDTLELHNDAGSGTYPWAGAASISGGLGADTLSLNDHTYKNWYSADAKELGQGTVQGFERLEVRESSAGTTYVASLFGNKFSTVSINGAGTVVGIDDEQTVEFHNVAEGERASATFTGTKASLIVKGAASGDESSVNDDGQGTEVHIGGSEVQEINISGSIEQLEGSDYGVLSLRLADDTDNVETLRLSLSSNTYIDFNDAKAGSIVTSDSSGSTGNLTTVLGGIELELTTLLGGSGNDQTTIYADFLKAEAVSFNGGAGDDTLSMIYGGIETSAAPVALTVLLGDGSDTFAVTGGNIHSDADLESSLITISDFISGTDSLQLDGYSGFTDQTLVTNAIGGAVGLSDAVEKVATLLLSGEDGITNYAQFSFGGNTYVYGDLSDDEELSGDLLIQLTGSVALSHADVADTAA